jgi:hypothetical protein
MTTHEDKAPSAASDLMLQLLLALDLHALLESEEPVQAVTRLHLAASILEALARYVRKEIENDRL